MTPQELKQWRTKAGLSRAGLADLLQVSPRTVESWEIESRGRKIPEREASRIKELMHQDVLKVPVTDEVRKKLEKMARERGVDPGQWAADLIKAALLVFAVGFFFFHVQRSTEPWTAKALKSSTKATVALVCRLAD